MSRQFHVQVVTGLLLAVLSSPIQTAAATTDDIPRMRPVRVFKDMRLKRPVQILARADQPELLYVLEQPGRVVVLDRAAVDQTKPKVFLDIRPEVRMKNNEEGLLSMAFSPEVAEDRRFYLYYSASSPRRSVTSCPQYGVRMAMRAEGTPWRTRYAASAAANLASCGLHRERDDGSRASGLACRTK